MEEKSTLPHIYDFYDYRKYLQEWYLAKKSDNRYVTYRYIGMKVSMDAGYLVKVFQGAKHISDEKVKPFSKLLNLSKRESEYFSLLLKFGKAKSESSIRDYFEQLLTYTNIKSHLVTHDRYEFYQRWYYSAIREIINCTSVTKNDCSKIGSLLLPRVSEGDVEKGIALLLRLGFVVEDERGALTQSKKFITTNEEWGALAIRSFHREMIQLAHDAVGDIAPSQRDLSTLTLTLSEDGLLVVKEKVREFRQELLQFCATDKGVNRVYQLNFNLFPLTEKLDGRHE